MANPKRDRQGPEKTPVGDRDEARPGHAHTGSADSPGGHADHDPTHGQAMPTEDGQVMDPLQAADRHGHDTHAGQGMGHGGHHGHGDHVAMFRRLFWIMLVLAVPTVLLSGMFASTSSATRCLTCPGWRGSPRSGHGDLPRGAAGRSSPARWRRSGPVSRG